MADSSQMKDPVADLRDKTAKYGVAYAIMGDAFKGRGITIVTKVLQVLLLASAVGVVGAAVWARVIG